MSYVRACRHGCGRDAALAAWDGDVPDEPPALDDVVDAILDAAPPRPAPMPAVMTARELLERRRA